MSTMVGVQTGWSAFRPAIRITGSTWIRRHGQRACPVDLTLEIRCRKICGFQRHVRACQFPGSSVVERSTVNRLVAGSNPARGATSCSPYSHRPGSSLRLIAPAHRSGSSLRLIALAHRSVCLFRHLPSHDGFPQHGIRYPRFGPPGVAWSSLPADTCGLRGWYTP